MNYKDKKEQAYKLYNSGKLQIEISEILGITPKTVSKWIRHYKTTKAFDVIFANKSKCISTHQRNIELLEEILYKELTAKKINHRKVKTLIDQIHKLKQ